MSHVSSTPSVMSNLLAKVSDSALRSFASQNDERDHQQVIVELATPPAEQEWFASRQRFDDRPVRGGRCKEKKSSAKSETHWGTMDELQSALQQLGLKTTLRLNLAEALAVEVTGPQLRRLVEIPLVAVVRPNRVRGVGR